MLCACTKEAVLQQGKNVYLTCETERKRFSDHSPFAWKRSDAAPVCILAEERFITGHDDTAGFIELLDADGGVVLRWMFDFPMKERFDHPKLYDDDCLILYLHETYHLPVRRGCGYSGSPKIVKVEELF
ncbi:MAG: hypothetical protein IJW77_05955 [Clostridia bacterium]|nr:hypothetical protein [Clostridia bacterium]